MEPLVPPAPVRQIWEHSQVDVNVELLNDTLKTFGDGGWELVQAIRIVDKKTIRYRLFFKRPKLV